MVQQSEYLQIIATHKEITVEELSNHFQIGKQNITRAINQLERFKFIKVDQVGPRKKKIICMR